MQKMNLFKPEGLRLLTAIIVVGVSIGFIIIAQAQEGEASITYPVAELAGCSSKDECQVFCDQPENIAACVSFAEKSQLMSKEEADKARKFVSAGSGPGGCTAPDDCRNYCDDVSHLEECLEFGERTGIMDPKELEEARKVKELIGRGGRLPGDCRSKSQCDNYCNDPNHLEECITFAEGAGLIEEGERQEARKVLAAVKRGVKPPACGRKKQCDQYCRTPEHLEECVNFALEAGMMPPEEQENAKMMIAAMKKGVKPPACDGKEECDEYCGIPEHAEECINFAEAAGMMNAKDAAMARKTGGRGPGGCRGQEECEDFCNNPDNQEACFSFAKENGMMSEDDLKLMEDSKRQMMEGQYGPLPGYDNTMPLPGESLSPEERGDQYPLLPQNFEGQLPRSEGQYYGPLPGNDMMAPVPSGSEFPLDGYNPPSSSRQEVSALGAIGWFFFKLIGF